MREGPYTVANYSSLQNLLIPHICSEEKVRCVCNKTSTKHVRFKLLRTSRKSRRNVRSPTLWSKVPKMHREKTQSNVVCLTSTRRPSWNLKPLGLRGLTSWITEYPDEAFFFYFTLSILCIFSFLVKLGYHYFNELVANVG